jgi:hypothetical protein
MPKTRDDDRWPQSKEDLQDDWNRAMNGYNPSIWDPYKHEADRLRSLGLAPTAANNAGLTFIVSLLLALGVITVIILLAK